jgi:hypothetical protein
MRRPESVSKPPCLSAYLLSVETPYAAPERGLILSQKGSALKKSHTLSLLSYVRASHVMVCVPERHCQQSNTDQQMSFRNRWSSSTSARIASGS